MSAGEIVIVLAYAAAMMLAVAAVAYRFGFKAGVLFCHRPTTDAPADGEK